MLSTPYSKHEAKGLLTAEEIILKMGKFEQETNVLKKYARRG